MAETLVRKARFLDLLRLDQIVVDDRKRFDNPLFINGAKPAYSTWFKLKPCWKFLSHFFHPKKQVIFLESEKRLIGASVTCHNLIDGFFINEEARGHGQGRKLMDFTLTFLKNERGFKKIKVGVQSDNLPAKKFYAKMGFKEKELFLER